MISKKNLTPFILSLIFFLMLGILFAIPALERILKIKLMALGFFY